ncbi:spindle and centriole-associated protein 1-like [Branchiostoma floridae]|uniref:Spindle and centriole-associated protein 1 n=1 Tax=Branchiostoma floridae TaxID=7739 RepID=A0A9J7ND62_BRAFL|nr:spindle and centriole-associated protein 1-like [Branchiostoma floridae]
MSFVRVSRPRQRFNSGSSKGRRKPRPKPSPPPWDDTTSDLSVHKATDEEIKHRHEVHQSKNLDVIRLENQKMMIQKARARPKTPSTVEKRKAALLREVLYDHSQLQDVLSKSDRVMAVVRDLFGDDPKRYTGFPNVTKAPDNPSGRGPVIEPPEQPTQLSMLSQSIMDQSALNEVDAEREQGEAGEEQTLSQQFESRLDLQRFRRFLEQERQQDSTLRQQDSTLRQQDSTLSTIPGEQQGQQGAATSTMLQAGTSHQVENSNPVRTVNTSQMQCFIVS